MDFVLCQISFGWMPSSSRRGSSSSNEADPDADDVEIVPPKDPDDDAAEPISKDMKGMAEEEGGGREGWNGAVGTRRWLMFPTAGLTPPPAGNTTGGTVNSLLAIFVKSYEDSSECDFFFPTVFSSSYSFLNCGELKGIFDSSHGVFTIVY